MTANSCKESVSHCSFASTRERLLHIRHQTTTNSGGWSSLVIFSCSHHSPVGCFKQLFSKSNALGPYSNSRSISIVQHTHTCTPTSQYASRSEKTFTCGADAREGGQKSAGQLRHSSRAAHPSLGRLLWIVVIQISRPSFPHSLSTSIQSLNNSQNTPRFK